MGKLSFRFEELGISELDEQEDADNVRRTKIGGWPTPVQSEPC